MNAVLLTQQLREGHVDAAQRTLAEVAPTAAAREAVPILLDICAVEATERGSSARRRARRATFAAGIASLILLLTLLVLAMVNSALFVPAFVALLIAVALTDPLKWFRAPRTTLQENAALSLLAFADGSDARVTGALVDALDCESTEARDLLQRTVTHLIWNLDGDEAALWLDDERRRILRDRVLGHYSLDLGRHRGRGGWTHLYPGTQQDFTDAETDFLVSSLRALATVRDPKATRLLERVAQSRTCGPNSETVALAAEECLGIAREVRSAWDADARRLRELLSNGNPSGAAQFLRTLSEPRQIALLLAALRTGAVRRRWHAALGVSTCASLAAMSAFLIPAGGAAFFALFAAVLLGGAWVVTHQKCADARPAEEAATTLLARYNDARLAAPAIDLLRAGRGSTALRRSLWRWLNELEPGSGGSLKERHRRYLRRLLKTPAEWTVGLHRHSHEPAIAALHALGVAGDLDAMDAAADIARSEAPVAIPLRDAAHTCLKQLRAARDRADAHHGPRS